MRREKREAKTTEKNTGKNYIVKVDLNSLKRRARILGSWK